ncbi:hypothetical protein [Escherichia coli]|nr:hypothetical protein [Escherichia coli]
MCSLLLRIVSAEWCD